MKKANLQVIPTMVESPFIIATIGGYTFGSCSASKFDNYGLHKDLNFPNYMKSMSVVKVNGALNQYTLTFTYQVAYGEDPNKLDKVFSRVATNRRISLSYGDWNAPNYIYKEETGIITSVTTSLDMASSTITYVVKCTSDAVGITSSNFNFPSMEAKPSDVITELVQSSKYGLNQVFTGMRDINKVLSSGLIASNDKKVKIQAQAQVTPLEYLNYLVNCMTDSKDTDDTKLSNSKYFLTVRDDVNNDLGGTYFTVDEVVAGTPVSLPADTYELDINYPADNYVMNFSLINDQSWAILYESALNVQDQKYSYTLDGDGKVRTTVAPNLIRSNVTGQVSAAERSWWSKMTSFPIQATLTLKGLTRHTMLMTYVKLNVWFHGGQKHISSGLYVITKQEDKIDSSGYRTTLNLLRVGGDQ